MKIQIKFRPSAIPDAEGVLYFHIYHKRVSRQVSTNCHLFISEWDSSASAVKLTGDNVRLPILMEIQNRLDAQKELLDLIIASSKEPVSPEILVDRFNNLSTRFGVFPFMRSVITELRITGKERTAETYEATLRSLQSFYSGDDLIFQQINSRFTARYQDHLLSKGCVLNTVSFYMRILRAIYNRAVRAGVVVDNMPFKNVFTGICNTRKRALPMPVIKKLKRLNLTAKPSLEYARDIFLLSYLLRGMSFVDMAFLRKTDLINGRIVYTRRKTKKRMVIEWTREMQQILDRYPANPTKYLLPIIRTSQSWERRYYLSLSASINRHLERIGEMLGLDAPLTMYVARHSWATSAKEIGIPLHVISDGLGHDSESTTRIYLSSLESGVIDEANRRIIRSFW